jgi:hypothetical protein
MGEPENALEKSPQEVEVALGNDADRTFADTLGGRVQIRWDTESTATPSGQFVFFAEFLSVTGLFEEWVNDCPLTYASHNAPTKRDVLGSVTLGVLSGNSRYAHLTAIRGDGLAAKALGCNKILSADAVRRGLQRIPDAEASPWMRKHVLRSVRPALQTSWIMDIDATVKPLYGTQEGARMGYNPQKPGRPSHVLHTYWMANLRLVLDVVSESGNHHSSAHSAEGLHTLLTELSPAERPAYVRGDSGYGNQPLMAVCEAISPIQPYLFRLRQTQNVKHLLARLASERGWSVATSLSQGWQAKETTLALIGWTHARRVIVLRRPLADGPVAAPDAQLALPMLSSCEVVDGISWEYTVLVTNSDAELESIGQLYRDRCDCENGFDELKNQWGWGGFTTQDKTRNQIMARTVALIYNWWSWYARAAHPEARLEAVTSRPLLLAAVGRILKHAGQTFLTLTPIHAATSLMKSMIRNISNVLQSVIAAAQQPLLKDPWSAFIEIVSRNILAAKDLAAPFGSLLRLPAESS